MPLDDSEKLLIEVVNSVKQMTAAVKDVGDNVKVQTDVMVQLHASQTTVLERTDRILKGMGPNVAGDGERSKAVTLTTLILVVGMCCSLGAFLHAQLRGDVSALTTVIGAEIDRAIAWETKHDREVIKINTTQADGINETNSHLCILWQQVAPDTDCPSTINQPRIDP